MNATSLSDAAIRFLPVESVPGPKRGAGRRILRWAFLLVFGGMATIPVAFGIKTAIQESRRNGCEANLKRLGLAFHNYHEAHGHFPAPAIMSASGKPLLSWRVALLPQLGYESLYARFRLDEPWDSPHNQSLLAEMPPELACPSGNGRRTGQTEYRVIVGPAFDQYSTNTPFAPDRGVEIREFTDGTSNTILALETEAAVPWTRPDDLHWAPNGPLPALKSRHGDGTHVLFADGSRRYVRAVLAPQILLSLLTINGGEVISGG